MLYILWLTLFGLLIGAIAKGIHPGDDPDGFLPTAGIGIGGSYIGGFINWMLGNGAILSMSGFIMSVVGAVILLIVYKMWKANNGKQQ